MSTRYSIAPPAETLTFAFLVATFGASSLTMPFFLGPEAAFLPWWLSVAMIVIPPALYLWFMVAVEGIHRWWARRDAEIVEGLAASLMEWTGLDPNWPVPVGFAAEWRRAASTGLTIAEAQRWSDHGFSFRVAAAALRDGMSLPEIEAIAAEVRLGGGAQDRSEMTEMLGTFRWTPWYDWRRRFLQVYEADLVLRQWRRIPLSAIAPAVRVAVSRSAYPQQIGESTWQELSRASV